MKISLRIIITLLFAPVLWSCSKEQAPSPEESCNFQQNSYLQRVSWNNTAPVVMYAHTSLSADQQEALLKAMAIWNETFRAQLSGKDIFKFGGTVEKVAWKELDNKNVVSITSDWEGATNEQAETLLQWNGTQIQDADIRINGNKNLATSDTVAMDELDTVALIVHELGHVLGLQHNRTENYTVMAMQLGTGTTARRTIGSTDLDALRCEY